MNVYHPLLHSIQDMIRLEDGREFLKTHCYCNGRSVGPTFQNSNNSSSSNSLLSDYAPNQTNYLPPFKKIKPKKSMKFRFEYHEVQKIFKDAAAVDSDDSVSSGNKKCDKDQLSHLPAKMIFESNSIQMKYV